MDNIPLHLFDYVTLIRLSTLNKRFNDNVKRELQNKNKIQEMYKYLKTTTRSQRCVTVINTLSTKDVWDMFKHIAIRKDLGVFRYVYVVMPIRLISIKKMSTASNIMDIFVDSTSIIEVKLANLFGYSIFTHSLASVMFLIWLYINITSTFICTSTASSILPVDVSTWFAHNIRVCKIDTLRKKIFVSEDFSLTTEIRTAPINTFFRDRAHASVIRSITLSLFSN